MEHKCEALIQSVKKIFMADITCCISRPCRIWEFYDTLHRDLELINTNVVYYGNYFKEEQINIEQPSQAILLELERMEEFLNQKKKIELLNYLKERMNDKINNRTLNEQILKQIKQEVLQAIYTYLGKKGIKVSGLIMDETLDELGRKSSQSVTDTIRWVNFFLERTFHYESEVQKQYTVVDKINQYVIEHYKENIGRNEIASHFFLAPEYLSKMYKKETGKSLTDFIAEYRIEQAKILLERGERISNVAEAVGIDNFTYFSTIFKKYTGMTPSQYKKKE